MNSRNPCNNPSILVVDDNKAIRELIYVVVQRRRLSCDQAGSVREARRFLRSRYYDILILDLTLPDGSGISILEELKNIMPLAIVAIITGDNALDTADQKPWKNVHTFMYKPFTLAQFEERLIEMIAEWRRRALVHCCHEHLEELYGAEANSPVEAPQEPPRAGKYSEKVKLGERIVDARSQQKESRR